MDNRTFRDAMGKFATGITVITTEHEGEVYGMTANAFMSISLEPKLIAVSIDKSASMFDILPKTDTFAVNMLKEEQKYLAQIFAKQIEKDKEPTYESIDGTPVLEDTLASVVCKVYKEVEAGDHVIFIAEVTNLKLGEGSPVLYFDSNYEALRIE